MVHMETNWICTQVSQPLTAIAIAISDSVTVSIGDDTSGAFRLIFLVRAEVRSCHVDKVHNTCY